VFFSSGEGEEDGEDGGGQGLAVVCSGVTHEMDDISVTDISAMDIF
jgi:hypothetical protein